MINTTIEITITFDVSGEIRDAEPDVGIMSPWAEDVVFSYRGVTLPDKISAALCEEYSEEITEALVEAGEPDPDILYERQRDEQARA